MENLSEQAQITLKEIERAGGRWPMVPQEVRQPDVRELVEAGMVEVKDGLPYVLVLK